MATLTFHLHESPQTLPVARWWRPRGPGKRHNRRPCTAGVPCHRAATQVARCVEKRVCFTCTRPAAVIAPRKLLPRQWRSLTCFRLTTTHSTVAFAVEWSRQNSSTSSRLLLRARAKIVSINGGRTLEVLCEKNCYDK